MEPGRTGKPSKMKKIQMNISSYGGGIGGLVLWGGAFVFACLVAARLNKKSKRRDQNGGPEDQRQVTQGLKDCSDCKNEVEESSKGLSFLFQSSSGEDANSCCGSYGVSKGSFMAPAECLILEGKPIILINGEKDMKLSSCMLPGIVQDPLLPVPDSLGFMKASHSREKLSKKTIEEEKMVGENLVKRPSVEEDGSQESDERSEITEESSVRSDADTVRPVELVGYSSKAMRETYLIQKVPAKNAAKLEETDSLERCNIITKDSPSSEKIRTRMLTMSMVLLFLAVLIIHQKLYYVILDHDSSVGA